ncbi:MAG: hypothetical protein FJ291_15365 [Planctomycetes bacterium]|nr:hypothetical protein [Planctomycetota bacterium]
MAATMFAWLVLVTCVHAEEKAVVPRIDGEWWQVAGDPDLGTLTDPKQQPVDFAVWQAADGSWQLLSCTRHSSARSGSNVLS